MPQSTVQCKKMARGSGQVLDEGSPGINILLLLKKKMNSLTRNCSVSDFIQPHPFTLTGMFFYSGHVIFKSEKEKKKVLLT